MQMSTKACKARGCQDLVIPPGEFGFRCRLTGLVPRYNPDGCPKDPRLTAEALRTGKTYRAKKPRKAGVFGDLYNDRTILWRDKTWIQYDGPAVPDGRHYPKISIEAFLAWADREVQEEQR